MRKRIIFLCLFSLVFPVRIVVAQSPGNIETLIGDLENQIPGLLKKYKVPGAAMAMIANKQVVMSRGFGFMDGKRRVTQKTLFQAASISKSVTAWGIMRLIEQNVITLDTPVTTYMGPILKSDSKYDYNKITVRHLLSHTAGLATGGYAGYPPDQRLPTLEECVQDVRLVLPPGAQYKYSGGGYTFLQFLIEEVTGQDFSLYMRENILIPLGMKSASFDPQFLDKTQQAQAYSFTGHPLPSYQFTARAAAGLTLSLHDLTAFLQANMGNSAGSRLLSEYNRALMYQPRLEYYGLGFLNKSLEDGTSWLYHSGTNRGWRTYFVILPEKAEALALLTNSGRGEHFIQDILVKWSRNRLGFTPWVLKTTNRISLILFGIGGGLLFISLIMICLILNNIIKQKLTFSFSPRTNKKQKVKKMIQIIFLGLLLPVFWYTALYTGILAGGWVPAGQLPYGIDFLSFAFIIFCILLSGRHFFVRASKMIN